MAQLDISVCRARNPEAMRAEILELVKKSGANTLSAEDRELHYWQLAGAIADTCRRHCDTCLAQCTPSTPCHHLMESVYRASRAADSRALPEITGMVSTTLWPNQDSDVP